MTDLNLPYQIVGDVIMECALHWHIDGDFCVHRFYYNKPGGDLIPALHLFVPFHDFA